MNDYVGKSCPYCKTKIVEGDDVVVCSACDMPHHKDCWIENQGCTTFGCIGTIKGADSTVNSVTATEINYDDTSSGEKYCPKCGLLCTANAVFCGKCGTKLPIFSAPVQRTPYQNVNASPQGMPYQHVNASPQGMPYQNMNASPQGMPYQNVNASPQSMPYQNVNASPQGMPYQNVNTSPQGMPYQNVNASPQGMPYQNVNTPHNMGVQYGNPQNFSTGTNNSYGQQVYNTYAGQTPVDNDVVSLVGTNTEYYVPKFQQLKQQNKSYSWNWMAFLFSPYWFIYRKMYLYGVGIIIAAVLLSFIPLMSILALGGYVVLGIFGNYIYMYECEKKSAQAKQKNEPFKTQFFQLQGGVNTTATAIAVAVHFVVVMLILLI